MYELNRVRLVGIGPRGARYSDVTLDMSGLGEQVPAQNLFDAPGRRPAPSSLLLLENGGGKSVLLKLLFSVVLPGRRSTIGGVSLDRFVLDTDTGHVAMEWMHVSTGDRLVTAKVYQRRTRTAGNNNPLTEAWYSFRPNQTLDLASLPVFDGDRRRRLEGFHEALQDLDRADATTEVAWHGDDQGKWRTHLRDRGIEPDLFDIQRRMNVDEGEAAKAFKYASSKEFVDWLLQIVTDPADASSVAETFATWATLLADREQLILERDFLEGTIAGLEPLAEAHDAQVAASRDAARARAAAEQLAGQLRVRVTAEDEAAAELADDLRGARAQWSAREGEQRSAREVLNETQLQTLRLQLADVEAKEKATTLERAAAELEAYGWEAVSLLAERDGATAAADALAAQVSAADADAAPALARRDAAAGDLLAKYDHEVEAAILEKAAAGKAAEDARVQASLADEDRTRAEKAAAKSQERYESATRVVEAGQQRLRDAAAQELVDDATTASEVPGFAADAVTQHRASTDALAAAVERTERAAAETKEARTALQNARETHTGAERAAERAARDLHEVTNAAELLLAMPAVAHAMGDESLDAAAGAATATITVASTGGPALSAPDLDEAVDRLLPVLATDLEEHSEHLAELRADQLQDVRILDALGEGGLLPPRPEVTSALTVLEESGVSAYPGWRYLHDAVAEDERAESIAAHPELADGVVLADETQIDRARSALETAQLLPAAAVAVGTTVELLTTPSFAPGSAAAGMERARFVIDPTPALFDEVAAETRREELSDRMNRRAEQRKGLEEQVAALRAAHDGLVRWRAGSPVGHLAKLSAAVGQANEALTAAEARVEEALGALSGAEHDQEEAETATEQARTDERAAAEHRAALDNLAEHIQSAATAQQSLSGLSAEVRAQESAAEQAGLRRASALTAQQDHTTAATRHEHRADRFRDAAASVPSTSGRPATAVPEATLAVLKAQAEAAHKTYLAMAANPDLRRDAEAASATVRQLEAKMTVRDPAHVAEAERLRATAAGADPVAWREGAATARARKDRLTEELTALTRQSGKLQTDVERATPEEAGRRSWTTLPEGQRPTSVEHGRELGEAAQQALQQATRLLESANARLGKLAEQRQKAESTARAIEAALLPLTPIVDVPTGLDIEPYQGNSDEAVALRDEAIAAIKETAAAVETANIARAKAITDLGQFARQTSFETLGTLARRSIIDSDDDALAARAGSWAGDLRQRLATITTDLENANRHRKNIVDRLAALVGQALRTLRQASKLSRLPEDLDEWGGRTFLRIRFSEPDTSAISVRVGEVVDRVAAEYNDKQTGKQAGSGRSVRRRDGISLLLECVHSSVPKGFTVDVLKPDSVLRDERVSIEEMNEVFSGGQELTAAIVLYCTLAALKANERGQMRAKHSGVLFLDNPIGRANASYLLDLQKAVARSLGVQLIYTTGISDDRVLAAFPLWVRLRNDADLRAGLKHIRVADVVRRHLPDPYDTRTVHGTSAGHSGSDESGEHERDSQPGTVTATRLYKQPAKKTATNAGRSDETVPVP